VREAWSPRASEGWVGVGLSSLLLGSVAVAATPIDGARAMVLLGSDAMLRVLGLALLVTSTVHLLMTSRRDWKRLAERERRAPGLLTSLGLDARGAHRDIRAEVGPQLRPSVEHRGETGDRRM